MTEPNTNLTEPTGTETQEVSAGQPDLVQNPETSTQLQEEEKAPTDRRPSKPKVSLCTKYGIRHPACHSRTEFCQHDFGCFENVVTGALRSFGIGYGIKTGLSLIGLLIGFKKLLKK